MHSLLSERQVGQRHILLGDIGATNARFAALAGEHIGDVKSFEVARFAGFDDVLAVVLKEFGAGRRFTDALFALAGPVENGRCALTNTSWIVDQQQLTAEFGFDARIVNDFQAVAFSLPALAPADLVGIGGTKPELGAARAVVGPGSGLGVACYIETPGLPLVVPSEGGHATLAANSEREDAIIGHLRRRFGHASAERAISGPGLENIYQAIAALDGRAADHVSAADITRRALDHECELCWQALDTFCAFFGSFAGNVALTFGARGGVYIAGGISPRIVHFLARSQFRSRFEAKGRFRPYLERIPCFVIVHPAAAFVGLKFLAGRSTAP